MAEAPARQDQVFESSILDLVSPTGRPKYLGVYQSSNQLVNSLAHLVGQDGLYSRLLACDESGVLKVQADSLDAIAAWNFSDLLAAAAAIQTAVEGIAAWNFDELYSVLVESNLYLYEIYGCILDVWDTTAHAIRTTT